MPMWLLILMIALGASAVFALVWWSSGRAGIRRTFGPGAQEAANAGMIETDALPGRSGFFH